MAGPRARATLGLRDDGTRVQEISVREGHDGRLIGVLPVARSRETTLDGWLDEDTLGFTVKSQGSATAPPTTVAGAWNVRTGDLTRATRRLPELFNDLAMPRSGWK